MSLRLVFFLSNIVSIILVFANSPTLGEKVDLLVQRIYSKDQRVNPQLKEETEADTQGSNLKRVKKNMAAGGRLGEERENPIEAKSGKKASDKIGNITIVKNSGRGEPIGNKQPGPVDLLVQTIREDNTERQSEPAADLPDKDVKGKDTKCRECGSNKERQKTTIVTPLDGKEKGEKEENGKQVKLKEEEEGKVKEARENIKKETREASIKRKDPIEAAGGKLRHIEAQLGEELKEVKEVLRNLTRNELANNSGRLAISKNSKSKAIFNQIRK